MSQRNYCKSCPMYWQGGSYWEEWDEGCRCDLDGWFDREDYKTICYMPRFIKKLYLRYRNWREERYWQKVAKYHEEKEKDESIRIK